MAYKHSWLYVALILCIPILNAQQSSRTHLTIHVSDASESIVPKAWVEVESTSNDTASTTQTDDLGNAELSVLPGNYQLSIKSPGFCFKKQSLKVLGRPEQAYAAVLDAASCPGPCQAACLNVQAEPPAVRTAALSSDSSVPFHALDSSLTIRTAHNSGPELATKAQLELLIGAHDLSQWTFTREIVIDEKSIPHSHPVLTLHTRHLKQDDELLSTYLHEQLHWFLTGHPAETRAAEQDLTKLYPKVPVGYPDGANDTESTYLHLLVCQLEQQADRAVLGDERTGEVIQFWAGDHYRWVYRTVMQDEAKIEDVLKRNHLDTPDARRPDQTP